MTPPEGDGTLVRVLGLDVGDRTVGVAVSDPMGLTAQGAGVIRRRSLAEDVAETLRRAAAWQVGRIVVGLPRSLDGRIGPQAEKVLAFVQALREAGRIPVTLWDERMTTRLAERALLEGGMSRRRRKALVDQVAAQLILQGYLDAARRAAGAAGDE